MSFEKNIEAWESRYTVKRFSDDPVKKEDIDYISSLFEYIPIQQGIQNHFWLRLGPEDQELKTFMYENICHVVEKNEHMYAIASAPYVFLSVIHEAKPKKSEFLRALDGADTGQKLINIGFHAGSILTEALHLGYDISQVGCMEGRRDKKIIKRFSALVRGYLTQEHKEILFQDPEDANKTRYTPVLAICIGTGLPLTEERMMMLDGYPAVTWQKDKKPGSNLVMRTPSE